MLLRSLVGLETGGGTEFFGEPQFDVADLLRTAPDGRGVISCVELAAVQDKPALWSTALMWLVAELFEALPEAGDLPQPKLVVFLDEAHLLFDDATEAFLEALARTVRLIRSKGVGVFFVTQQPTDLSEEVLAQLGLRIQHALRAFTPADAKKLRATVSTYPVSDLYDVETLLTSVGIGEAAVTLLSEKGVPTPVVHTRMVAPASRMDPADDVEGAAKASPLWAEYGTRTDAQSAREILAGRLAPPAEPKLEAPRASPTCGSRWSTSRRRASASPNRAGRRRPGDRAPTPSATSSAPARARRCRRRSRAGSSGCSASGSDAGASVDHHARDGHRHRGVGRRDLRRVGERRPGVARQVAQRARAHAEARDREQAAPSRPSRGRSAASSPRPRGG